MCNEQRQRVDPRMLFHWHSRIYTLSMFITMWKSIYWSARIAFQKQEMYRICARGQLQQKSELHQNVAMHGSSSIKIKEIVRFLINVYL